MKKGDKGGQGFTWSQMFGLILGVIVIIIVVLFVTGFFDRGDDVLGNLPKELQIIASSCGLASSSGLKISYCDEFREVEIAGQDQLVNCEYIKEQYETNYEDSTITCSTALETQFCTSLRQSKGDDYTGKEVVNGKPCSEEGNVLGSGHWGVPKIGSGTPTIGSPLP